MSDDLPAFLFSGWQFRQGDIAEAKARGDLDGWTVSSLCSAYLKYQLDRYDEESQSNVKNHPESLASLSVRRLVATLRSSVNLPEDVEAIAESLDYWIQEPSTPYLVLKLLDMSPKTTIQRSKGNRKMVDIDEAVLAGERCIRSGRHKFVHSYLVNLKDLATIFGPPNENGLITIKRKNPPKGSFETLDCKRRPVLQIQGSNDSFATTFDRVTRNVLKGLDWGHVFIQGDMVLNTLLHTDPSRDHEGDVAECDIELYLYDLTPEEANQKFDEIYKVYTANSDSKYETLIVKTSKSITFFPRYPDRRMQVVLKLQHSPLESLLRIDLDACAIAYDGSQVFMLPRCARALETGYNVFTMDLIWGHRLGSRRETQSYRLFKYADRGFGLRILHNYVRSLESKCLDDTVMSNSEKCPATGESACKRPPRIYKDEPGLKTIRRIARLAQKFVRRWHFGRSKGMELDRKSSLSFILLPTLDRTNMDTGIPDPYTSIGVFEHFMRKCVAWRLNALNLAFFDEEERYPETLAYEFLEIYDGLPLFEWDKLSKEDLEEFKDVAEYYDRRLSLTLHNALTEKLHIDYRLGHHVSRGRYLTRHACRLIASQNIRSVQARRLTMPLIIPTALQTYITEVLGHRYIDLPDKALSKLLMPIHDPSMYDPIDVALPPLQDSESESGNLRYWRITNESIWTGHHRVLDEVADLLLILFYWFTNDKPDYPTPPRPEHPTFRTDDPGCIWFIAEFFRRRLILPKFSDTQQMGETPPERDARLFREWVLARPSYYQDRFTNYFGKSVEQIQSEVEQEIDIDDKLFWQDGDEGTWDCEEGVPMWREVDDISDLGNLSI